MKDIVHIEEYKGYTIKIYCDENAESPREWDNIGNMLCFHNRYKLGDEQALELWSETKECKLKDIHNYCDSWDEIEEILRKDFNAIVILPLYLYDHSGITIKTSPFGCRWDSGQVGFIFVPKDRILKEFNAKRLTKSILFKAEEILNSEIKIYDDYIHGEIYGYKIIDKHGEEIDSHWGYIGDYNGHLMEACTHSIELELAIYQTTTGERIKPTGKQFLRLI
jgi:hypothetical protein